MENLRRLTTLANIGQRTPAIPIEACDILSRWNLQRDAHNVHLLLPRLAKLWNGWTPFQRACLLRAVEAIAAAERARGTRIWNPRANRNQQLRLAKSAIG